jgi:hypothetical protein
MRRRRVAAPHAIVRQDEADRVIDMTRGDFVGGEQQRCDRIAGGIRARALIAAQLSVYAWVVFHTARQPPWNVDVMSARHISYSLSAVATIR